MMHRLIFGGEGGSLSKVMCMAKSIKSDLDWFKHMVLTINKCTGALLPLSTTLEMILKKKQDAYTKLCCGLKKIRIKEKNTQEKGASGLLR